MGTTDSGLDLETKIFSTSGRGKTFFLTSLFIELIDPLGGSFLFFEIQQQCCNEIVMMNGSEPVKTNTPQTQSTSL